MDPGVLVPYPAYASTPKPTNISAQEAGSGAATDRPANGPARVLATDYPDPLFQPCGMVSLMILRHRLAGQQGKGLSIAAKPRQRPGPAGGREIDRR